VLGGAGAVPPNTWNFGLVFGKQPHADLGGPAPVDTVPTQILSPCTCLLVHWSLRSKLHWLLVCWLSCFHIMMLTI